MCCELPRPQAPVIGKLATRGGEHSFCHFTSIYSPTLSSLYLECWEQPYETATKKARVPRAFTSHGIGPFARHPHISSKTPISFPVNFPYHPIPPQDPCLHPKFSVGWTMLNPYTSIFTASPWKILPFLPQKIGSSQGLTISSTSRSGTPRWPRSQASWNDEKLWANPSSSWGPHQPTGFSSDQPLVLPDFLNS